jgi:hypothetical protein
VGESAFLRVIKRAPSSNFWLLLCRYNRDYYFFQAYYAILVLSCVAGGRLPWFVNKDVLANLGYGAISGVITDDLQYTPYRSCMIKSNVFKKQHNNERRWLEDDRWGNGDHLTPLDAAREQMTNRELTLFPCLALYSRSI